MSQVVSKLVDAARQGNPRAIGQLLSQRLRPRGIQVRILLQQGYLQIRLDSPRALPQQAIVDWTKRWIVALHSEAIHRVRLYAWQPNQYFPDWMARFEVMRHTPGAISSPDHSPSSRETDGPRALADVHTMGIDKNMANESMDPASNPTVNGVNGDGNSNSPRGAMADTASTLDLAAIPEQDRLAYYGALYAIANIDGHLDPREVAVIEEIMNLQGLSEPAKEQVSTYRNDPPALVDCLAVLAEADESLRIGLMMNLIDTSWANEELDPLERDALKLAQRSLNISDSELESIEGFVREMRSRGAQSFAQLDLSS